MVSFRSGLAIASLWTLSAGLAAAQLPFFPGAEGYGGSWSGTAPSRRWLANATVYRVTNLNDSGPGSFRGAFQENSSNRIIIFDVAGVIQLGSSTLDIKNLANYYIAGQTAPGPVTIYGNMTQLTHSSNRENRNVVLRYLDFRKGDGAGSDSITLAGSGLGTNIILDHVSASWSEDEILSVANNNTNVTVQYSTIHDALVNNHAYGSLIRPRISSQVSFHHNLYAHNASRQARFGSYNAETLTADFRNNVIYNFRDRASYAGGSSESDREYADVNYVGNYIIAGPNTNGQTNRAFSVDRNIDVRVYQSGNFIDADKLPNPGGQPNGSDTGWGMFGFGSLGTPVQTLTQMNTPFNTPPVTTQSATEAYWQVVNYVGNWWWDRTGMRQRVIDDVVNFNGYVTAGPNNAIPASPNAAELAALLATPMTTHPANWDSDGDGMPDWWEVKHGLNPHSAADQKLDFDNDGYINLIEYINERGEFPAPAPIEFHGGHDNRYAQIFNWKTNDGGVTAGSYWQPSKYDQAVIRSGAVVVDSVGQHARVLQVAPQAGDSATLNVAAGWIEVQQVLDVGAAGAGVVNHSGGSVIVDMVALGGAPGASGVYNLSGSGTLVVNLLGKGAHGGEFHFTGGTLVADVVAFDLVNQGGVISPGGSPGLTHIVGDLTQTAGSILIELAGTAAGQFDHVLVEGALHAGGALNVQLVDGFVPSAGDSFDIFSFASATGDFAFSFPALEGDLGWDTSALLTTGTLSVTSASALPNADFNGDGYVDGADFLLLQRNLGLAGQIDNSLGDADGDSLVDSADLFAWQQQYLATRDVSGAGISVPEPTAALLAAGLATLLVRRRRRTA
ncbi:MAG TPA: hypothetical protein PJ982_11455 [Lacipirellulaceae bacterium]|nr:hypothetical protein [Lacipirellulaceae bacterium]